MREKLGKIEHFIQSILGYIKENIRFFLFLLAIYLFFTFPLPYYIYTGGGIIPIKDRVEIKEAYQEKGSFNLAYVSELRGTPVTMLLSKIRKDWDVVKEEVYKISSEDTEKEISFRNKIALESANQNAIYFAYQKAGKSYSIRKKHFYVLYVKEKEKAPLEVGDDIIKVSGEELSSLVMYQNIVKETPVGEKIPLVVLRDGKEETIEVEVFVSDQQKMTGLSVREVDDYETNPTVKLHFKASESGPSGGLMMGLAIYNRLTKEDLTKGKKIVGTGTLESDGTVGEIGGVLYKLRGAVSEKADVFIVPSGENYEDCLEEKNKKKYDIELIAVDSLDDAIEKLKKWKAR